MSTSTGASASALTMVADGAELVPGPWDTVDELIAATVDVDRAITAMTAWRTRLIDQARRLGESVHRATLTDIRSVTDIPRRTMVAELACALGTSERAMNATVDTAQLLVEDFPTTLAAMGRGELSARHADVILAVANDLDAPDRTTAESHLINLAQGSNVPRFRSAARRWRERHHPRPLTERHAEARSGRCVLLDPAPDGMAWLTAHLPAPHAWAIYDGLTDAAASLQGPHENRTLAQLRADVLSDHLLNPDTTVATASSTLLTSRSDLPGAGGSALAEPGTGNLGPATPGSGASHPGTMDSATPGPEGRSVAEPAAPAEPAERRPYSTPEPPAPPSWRGIRPTVSVTVPVMTLLGHSQEPGHLAGYGPIDPDTARELAARAPTFNRILTHPETGTVLSVGRTQYTVPADLRRYLRLRDETCRFPGCGRRAQGCDLDHTTAWEDGGATSCENLAHLCRHHHRLKHEGRWRVRQEADGVLRWTSPTGRSYLTRPAVDLGTPPGTDPAPAGTGPAPDSRASASDIDDPGGTGTAFLTPPPTGDPPF